MLYNMSFFVTKKMLQIDKLTFTPKYATGFGAHFRDIALKFKGLLPISLNYCVKLSKEE